MNLAATPTDGADAASASRPCAAAGCSVSFASPIGGETLHVDLTDAQNLVVHSGSLYVFAQSGSSSVGVAFGGTPATIKISAKPASFITGSASSATVRVLAYGAQGNRLIGQIAFPSPVMIASSDATGTLALSGSTIAAPNDTLTLSYTGGAAAAGTVLTPSSSQGTKVLLNVNVVAPPHKTADGHSSGDFIIPSQEEIEAVPTGPPGVQPLVVSVPPVSVDLSAQMPPVGDQGEENSCVGWASGYAIKSSQEALEHKWFGVTTQA